MRAPSPEYDSAFRVLRQRADYLTVIHGGKHLLIPAKLLRQADGQPVQGKLFAGLATASAQSSSISGW